MKSSNVLRCVGAVLMVAGALAISTDARASVSNPGNIDVEVPSGLDSIYSGGGHLFNLIGPTVGGVTVYGTINGDVDSSGNFVPDIASFPTVTTSLTISSIAVNAQLQVSTGSSSGFFDPSAGSDLTLHARFVFTGGGISGSCSTAFFNVTLSTRKNWLDGSHGVDYNTSTGSFRANATDFAIPAITTGCSTSTIRSTINNYWGFNGTSGSIGMKFDTAFTNPILAP